MTTLSIIIAVAALAGFAAVWLQLNKFKAAVNRLERVHEPPEEREFVGLDDIGILPDEVYIEPANLIILGYEYQTIVMDNQSNGKNNASKSVTIEIPEGTTHIVPSIKGFGLVFGKLVKGTIPDTFGAEISDHHLGLESVNISVDEIGSGTAILTARMLLRDNNGDDGWGGAVSATILLLGRHP